jgi:hypothetical protein
MTIETTDLRAAALEAVRLLNSETSPASCQARQVLVDAIATELPPAARAALDPDSNVQAAIRRIEAGQEMYYLANEDGTPGNIPFERGNDERVQWP